MHCMGLYLFIILYIINKQSTHYGRRGTTFEIYESKKRFQLQPLRSRLRSWRHEHCGASAFETLRDFAARTEWHLQSCR